MHVISFPEFFNGRCCECELYFIYGSHWFSKIFFWLLVTLKEKFNLAFLVGIFGIISKAHNFQHCKRDVL